MGNVSGSDVHFVGYVDEWNLPALYDQASALCYPSLWEGFGLPILEAMSHGTPVVTSRGTSTEEVAGGAAVLVDPTSVDDILRGVREALNSRTDLASRGRTRAAAATWSNTARETAAVYDEVLA
jgi:glycosyltransferase involved in cell wall biosynthesis